MSLTGMYQYAQQVAQGKFDGTFEEQGGKLVIRGSVGTEAELNEIWNAIKTIPTWRDDINADITVTGSPAAASDAAPASRTYTVKSGDTLSGIAKSELGEAMAYMKIFELNKDQLTNPDLIKPGQVLRLP